jgi:plastocyanin
MTMRILLGALLGAMFLPSALAKADNPRLVATVGRNDTFTISLQDASGRAVTNLDPGTYDIEVHDLSEEHNFHLVGPGVDQATDIASVQDVVWTVTFANGTYRFQCDAHSTIMRGRFTVGPVAAPPTALKASVGPKLKISLQPKTVTAGPARITVVDRSRADNFHLVGPGVNRKTGVAFRGRVTWSVTLQAGRYAYRSDKHKRLRGALTVTSS